MDGTALTSASLAPVAPNADDARIGARICGRYEIRRVVADGGVHRAGGVFGERTRQFAAVFRAAGGQDRGRFAAVTVAEPAQEGLDRRQRACQRAGRDAAPAFMRHPGAQVGLTQRHQRTQPHRAAMMTGEEVQKAGHVAAVGGDGIGGAALEGGEMGQPLLQRVAFGGREREAHASQRRMARSKLPAKKAKRSVPCEGRKWWGSSEPKAKRPGSRPVPKSSRISASDRTQPAASP